MQRAYFEGKQNSAILFGLKTKLVDPRIHPSSSQETLNKIPMQIQVAVQGTPWQTYPEGEHSISRTTSQV